MIHERHQRHSLRLSGYDYSQAGAYFVTVCTKDRACLFGEVASGEMQLNTCGRLVEIVWGDLPNHYGCVALDTFMVMPNHVHGIVVITDDVGAGLKPAPTDAATAPKHHGLSEIIRGFKTFSARRINEHRHTTGASVWQRNYYEHIIRTEDSLHRIQQYILNNPMQWHLDRENPEATAPEPEAAWLK